MTPEEIEKLDDEKLRLAIAKRIGWRRIHTTHDMRDGVEYLTGLMDEYGWMPVPDWVQDSNDTDRLIDDIVDNGYSIHIVGHQKDRWSCNIMPGNVYAEGTTRRNCVCKAWLVWKGEE